MTYVKVDDLFPEHPKVLEIGPLGEALWLRGLCYAARNQTDGFIPAGFVKRMGDMDALAEADSLASAGLWDAVDGGWAIHEYTEWQRSKAEIDDISAKRAEAGSKGGKQKSSKPEASCLPVASDVRKQNESKTQAYTDTDTDTDTDKGDTPLYPPTPKPPNPPWSMLEALCDELGQDATALSKPARDKQLAAAKRLTTSGFGEGDLRAMVRWLAPQSWVTSGVDLFLIEKQRGKWELAGKPNAPPELRMLPQARAPNGKDIGLSNERLEAIVRGDA